MSGSSNPLQSAAGHNFDLTPDPRVLQMLGEIDLHQWRCLAELVDNSVDGFLNAERAGASIENPEVVISVPRADTPTARITVRDNGPGMSADTLEKAVRAGWTGNSPLINLGLFGMGFNIATARLGLVTEVWTSRAGDLAEVGVRIDFEDLRSKRSFSVPRVTRPKMDPINVSGSPAARTHRSSADIWPKPTPHC